MYGAGRCSSESREYEVAAQRLRLFQIPVRPERAPLWNERTAQIVGFRYFNVYGPREQHKGRMASVAFHFFNQYRAEGKVKLFEGCDGYANGEQRRDFVSIEDVVKVNMWFLDHPDVSGIFNLGTGRARASTMSRWRRSTRAARAARAAGLTLEQMQAQGIDRATSPFPKR